MKGSVNYLVSTNTPYLNKKQVGDKELIINTEITERDAQFVNRIGKVEGIPTFGGNSAVQNGDAVVVHHNVFRHYYDVRQNLRHSSSYIKDGLYRVDVDQIFAKQSPGGVWEALDGFSFVKPMANTDEWSTSTEEALKGELYFEGKGTDKLGISKGDTVGFTPNSEYEFVIDGVRLYRVYTADLNILFYEPKETTEAPA